MKRPLMMSAFAIAVSLSTGFVLAADQETTKENARAQKMEPEQVHGSQPTMQKNMTKHRAKMHSSKAAEDREKIRNEPHERMKARGKDQGAAMPDNPPMDSGNGMGSGGMRKR